MATFKQIKNAFYLGKKIRRLQWNDMWSLRERVLSNGKTSWYCASSTNVEKVEKASLEATDWVVEE